MDQLVDDEYIIESIRNPNAMVVVGPTFGRDRVRLTVAADGTARLEFLDEDGEVVLSLPE